MRLIYALEDNDDVSAVHANFDVDAELLEKLAGCSGVFEFAPARPLTTSRSSTAAHSTSRSPSTADAGSASCRAEQPASTKRMALRIR